MKKILVLIILSFGLSSGLSAQLFKKKTDRSEVAGVTGTLILHPDSIAYKGSDGDLYFLFYDFNNKCLFISKTENIYQKFSEFLPEVVIPGRYISLEGTIIDPFTTFSRNQLEEEGERLGIKLNKFKMVKMFNYGMYPGKALASQKEGKLPLDKFLDNKN